MIVAVVGHRELQDYELVRSVLDKIKMDCIVSGGARGADTLAEQYALEHDIPIVVYEAGWHRYGRGAGPKRNQLIVDYADRMVAFLDEGSRGTADSIRRAKKKGIEILIVNV